MEEENRVFWVITEDGTKFNVEATDVVDAAVKASEEVDRRDIFMVIDIPG